MNESHLERHYPISAKLLTQWWWDARKGIISWQDVSLMLHGAMIFTIKDAALQHELAELHILMNFFVLDDHEKGTKGLRVVRDE